MRKVTIQDVAKELNLSRNTVAKALNNSDTVAYETRYVVVKRAYEMGYTKLLPSVLNEFKIKDSVEKSKTVVVLARREISAFWNRIIMGISDELNKNNCKLQFNFISNEDEKERILPIDMQSDISGIILLSVFDKEYVNMLVNKSVPLVFLDSPVNTSDSSEFGDVVVFEGENSVRRLTEHLIEQGMKKIGFIGDISYCKTIYDRYKGYCLALWDAGIPVDDQITAIKHVKSKYYNKEEVLTAIEEMPYIPEAIVCANDDIAKDVMLVLKHKELAVPNDVAVTGFDNKEETALIEPALSTVHIGNQRMGRRLVQELMWRINNRDLPNEIIYINTEVMIRESSIKNNILK